MAGTIIVVIAMTYIISKLLFIQFGWFKKLHHDILGECRIDDKTIRTAAGGKCCYGYCKHCGKRIVVRIYNE